jgi:hypothetical protein
MRKKILVHLESAKELNIYDAISEKGSFEKFIFSNEEINYLSQSGYFRKINLKYGLDIGLYEEQVICDKQIIVQLINDTKEYKFELSNAIYAKAFGNIIAALELAIKANSCIYFIL